jgi:hypothetical protein
VLDRQQQHRLVVLDLQQVVPAVLDDVGAQRPLRKHRVARDQHVTQLDLPQQGHGLRQLALALADGQLGQHGAASAGEDAEQVATRQRLGLGPADRLAIDGERFQRHGRGELGHQPGPQRGLEGAHL